MAGRRGTLLLTIGLIAVMLGLTAASVPLYRLFCQVTGYGGTPRIVASDTAQVGNTLMTVRFDTNVMPDMPWTFRPEQTKMTVRLGEPSLAVFSAENNSDEAIVGTAVFNVSPAKAATFIDKIQCFCFTQQRLEAHQKADLPVTFYIDPAILKDRDTFDLRTVTLSYTFYKSRKQTVGTASQPAAGQGTVNGTRSVTEGRS
jgi:cytochrome c oxidase assembly protein subunit 11